MVLLPRLWVLPFNENLYGDAVVRTELANRWAGYAHWIASYGDGAYQFGPLQIYLVGLTLKLGVWAEHAGRLVSFLFGVLTVLPLFSLTRRLFGWQAGVWACAAFSLWGLHIQFSSTAGSESLSLFLIVSVVALFAQGFEERRFAPYFGAALLLNLACATRYDAWLLMPWLVGVLLWEKTDRVAAWTRAVFFGLLCLPFPLLWMQGNEVAHQDPFFPIRAIEQFHRDWIPAEVARLGEPLYRLHNFLFWPATALFTLSPGIALLGAVGMVRTWRKQPALRWLILTALIPTAYFTFKGAVLLNFAPLGRFTANQLVLLLPFVGEGFRACTEGRGRWLRVSLGGLVWALAVACPLVLGIYTFRKDGGWRDTFRPVSPVTTNPVELMRAARFLKEAATKGGKSLALDDAPFYMDLQLAFYTRLPEERLARYRWETFRQTLMAKQPEFLVRFDGGNLIKDPRVQVAGKQLTVDGLRYDEMDGFGAPVHVYRRGP